MTRPKTLSRRSFLLGSAAALAASTASLPWWKALAQPIARTQPVTTPHNLILVFAKGGWDTTACLDPKLDLETVDSAPGRAVLFGQNRILTDRDRPAVTQLFRSYGDIATVVNGIEVRSIAHEECTKRIFTGTNSDANPDVGAITGATYGDSSAIPYMVLGDTAFTGTLAGSSGRAGAAGQIVTLLHPDAAYSTSLGDFGNFNRFRPSQAEAGLVRSFLQRRADTLAQTRGARGVNHQRTLDFSKSITRREELKRLINSLDDFSSQLEFQPQAELAVILLKEGLSNAVLIEHNEDWDTHENSHAQQLPLFQDLFSGVHGLLDNLQRENLLENTTVVVLSEMSRTPKLNANDGKDHWPVTSALVFSTRTHGGMTFGATDDLLNSVPIDLSTGLADTSGKPLTAANFSAGLLTLLGIDSQLWLPNTAPLTGFIKS